MQCQISIKAPFSKIQVLGKLRWKLGLCIGIWKCKVLKLIRMRLKINNRCCDKFVQCLPSLKLEIIVPFQILSETVLNALIRGGKKSFISGLSNFFFLTPFQSSTKDDGKFYSQFVFSFFFFFFLVSFGVSKIFFFVY